MMPVNTMNHSLHEIFFAWIGMVVRQHSIKKWQFIELIDLHESLLLGKILRFHHPIYDLFLILHHL